jgi:hypothetical protein
MIEGQDCRKVRLSCGPEQRHALNHAENSSCHNQQSSSPDFYNRE